MQIRRTESQGAIFIFPLLDIGSKDTILELMKFHDIIWIELDSVLFLNERPFQSQILFLFHFIAQVEPHRF